MPTAATLAALNRGATILTGNQRAARTLTRQFAQYQCAQGRTVWRSPEVLPWSAWTRSLWQQLLVDGHETRLLLNPLQEIELWRRIITDDDRLATLQSSASLAPLAQRAHTLLHRHRARRNLEFHNLNADQQALLRWLHAFERTCQQDGLLSAAELEPALAQHSQHLRLAPGYLLHGFDGLTPSQQDLLDTLRPLTTFAETEPTALAAAAELHTANSPEDELHYLAQQVRDLHQSQPEAQIAVIVPDVQAQRSSIERAFRNTIAPWLNRIGNQQPAPFEFTLGTPLALQPAIVDVLRLIRWTGQSLPLDEVSSLLRSPFLLGAEHEFLSRAEFDARDLHDQPLVEPALTAQQVLTLLRSSRRADHLRQLTTVLESIHRSSTRSRSFTAWTAHLRTLLEACGWPGERTLDSAGFQLIERWNDLLDDLNALDFSSGTFSFRHMLSTLQQAAHSTLFSLRSNNAPIQIMGALESAGSTFDAVFFLNASSSAWPAPASAHPLLPFALQRITSMPGADASADLLQAQRITSRILTSAPRITVTYAKQSSESEQLPSPLFAHLPKREVTPQAAPQPIALQSFDDSRTIPSPSGLLHGGASILKNQAACAFRAFAEHRLNAGGLQDDDDAGLTHRSRGNLAHQALEDFWHTIKTQTRLKELTQAELDAQIDASIQAAFAKIQADPSPWNKAYLRIQQERLHQLLLSWLEMEKQRSPFEVEAVEKKRDAVGFGPLQLNLRVDRIDRVAEGLVLIDYKTGDAHPKSWLGDRPDEPQLPLYASLPADEPIAAIAFATLRSSSKERKLIGFEAEKDILPTPARSQPAEPFRETLAHWKSTLLQLAEDFYTGQSQVNPKNYPKTCEHCDQRLLCRLNPALLDDADDDSEEETDE